MKTKDGKCISFFAFTTSGKITPVPCGKWSCPVCSKKNAKLWAWRARLQLDGSTETYFVWTFTLGTKYKVPRKGYEALPRLWDNLRKVVQRFYANKTQNKAFRWVYMAFVETQTKKRKMPHFHIITNIPAPYRIKDFAVHNGFGNQAYEDTITGKQAAYYVSKYVSKGDPAMPKSFRRVRTSQSWAKLPPFVGNKLYVKSKKESITDFLVRVSDATGKDIDELWEQWKWAHEMDD